MRKYATAIARASTRLTSSRCRPGRQSPRGSLRSPVARDADRDRLDRWRPQWRCQRRRCNVRRPSRRPIDCLACWRFFCFGGCLRNCHSGPASRFPAPGRSDPGDVRRVRNGRSGWSQAIGRVHRGIRAIVRAGQSSACRRRWRRPSGDDLRTCVRPRGTRGWGPASDMDRYDALRGLSRIQPSRLRTAPDRVGGTVAQSSVFGDLKVGLRARAKLPYLRIRAEGSEKTILVHGAPWRHSQPRGSPPRARPRSPLPAV